MRLLYIPREIKQYMRVFKMPEYIKEHPEVQRKYTIVLLSRNGHGWTHHAAPLLRRGTGCIPKIAKQF